MNDALTLSDVMELWSELPQIEKLRVLETALEVTAAMLHGHIAEAERAELERLYAHELEGE